MARKAKGRDVLQTKRAALVSCAASFVGFLCVILQYSVIFWFGLFEHPSADLYFWILVAVMGVCAFIAILAACLSFSRQGIDIAWGTVCLVAAISLAVFVVVFARMPFATLES